MTSPGLPQVIVLNGGSSSGKSTVAGHLQRLLDGAWLVFGVDTLADAMPGSPDTIQFLEGGRITIGPLFRPLEDAWMRGVAEMVRAGAPIILDEVWLSGAAGQLRWAAALEGLDVLWAGVRCDAAVAAAREAARGDRIIGMAAAQAEVVHDGVTYDVVVDTTDISPEEAAQVIAAAAVGARQG